MLQLRVITFLFLFWRQTKKIFEKSLNFLFSAALNPAFALISGCSGLLYVHSDHPSLVTKSVNTGFKQVKDAILHTEAWEVVFIPFPVP